MPLGWHFSWIWEMLIFWSIKKIPNLQASIFANFLEMKRIFFPYHHYWVASHIQMSNPQKCGRRFTYNPWHQRVGLKFSCISKIERVIMDKNTLVHLRLDLNYHSLNKISNIYLLKWQDITTNRSSLPLVLFHWVLLWYTTIVGFQPIFLDLKLI